TGLDSSSAGNSVFSFMRHWLVPITVVVGLLIALVGTSNLSRFNFGTQGVTSFLTDLAIAVAGPMFVVALIFSLSIALDQMLRGHPLFGQEFLDTLDELSKPTFTTWLLTLKYLGLGFVIAALLASTTSLSININAFSLHALYRNRLVRAFLGASRESRRPD